MTIYLFGKLTKNKFYTPLRTYSHKIEFPQNLYINTFIPCKYTSEIEVFYQSPIFNSYVIGEEENVTRLYSLDNKLTIIKNTGLKNNTIHTFKIAEESSSVRVCTIFKYTDTWVGMETQGKLDIRRGKPTITTIYGTHPIVLQNNKHNKKIKSRLWKVDGDKMYFVEIENPVKNVVTLSVNKVTDSIVMVSDQNIRGVIMTKDLLSNKIRESITCYVKEEMLGFYVFGEVHEIHVGDHVDARVIHKKDDMYELQYQMYNGIIKINNINPQNMQDKYLRGKILKVEDGQFEMSQIDYISIPFDITELETNELENLDLQNSEENELINLLNLIKKLTEYKKYDSVKKIFYKNIGHLNSVDKDKFSIVYCNFLEYANLDILKELRKISKYCTPRFLEKVGENTENVECLEFCFCTTKSRRLYRKYLSMKYESDIEKIVLKYPENMDISIEIFYENEQNPRVLVEKVIGKSKVGWSKYIELEEDVDYKRLLYRRVIGMKWKVSEMKEWYRQWLQFEKSVCGNVEEVRSRAKEFVASVRKNE